MRQSLPLTISVVLLAFAASAQDATNVGKLVPAVYHRTVFLGDSITDGNTYPQLVRDALGKGQASAEKMVAINAGIGGDTAAGMRGRIERDVLAHHPTLVTLSAGANDALHGVAADVYERDVRAIAERLKQEHIPLILLAPNMLGPKRQAAGQKNLDAYEVVLRHVAGDYGLRVAEVNRRQRENAAAGHVQLAEDDLHPGWEGQRMIARAVLDAMGYADVQVPDRIENRPLPGIIAEWKMKAINPPNAEYTDAAISQMEPDDSWFALKLPETTPIPDADDANRWIDDNRTLGASVSLRQNPARRFLGIATLHSDAGGKVQFHTGAELEQIWLNGQSIYRNDSRHGYHIGRESVAVELKRGDNRVTIKTGRVFFLSVTKGAMWAE